MCNCVNSCYVPLRFRLTKFRALSIPLTHQQCPTNRIICLLGLWIFHHCLHKNIWVNSSDTELRHLSLISFRFFLGFCKSRKNDCWNGKQCCEYLFLLKNHSKVQWNLCSSLMWLKVKFYKILLQFLFDYYVQGQSRVWKAKALHIKQK